MEVARVCLGQAPYVCVCLSSVLIGDHMGGVREPKPLGPEREWQQASAVVAREGVASGRCCCSLPPLSLSHTHAQVRVCSLGVLLCFHSWIDSHHTIRDVLYVEASTVSPCVLSSGAQDKGGLPAQERRVSVCVWYPLHQVCDLVHDLVCGEDFGLLRKKIHAKRFEILCFCHLLFSAESTQP